MTLRCVCIAAMILLQAQTHAQLVYKDASQPLLYVYRGDDERIYSWNPETKATSKIFDAPAGYPVVAPQGLVAFQRSEGERSPGIWLTTLVIVKTDGSVVKKETTDRPLQDFAWSPDGTRLVFVTGLHQEQVYDSYGKAETFIYDVGQDKISKILDGGARVTWPSFDGNLYIYDRRTTPVVRKYDPVSGDVSPTEYEDINFNEDGKYYYREPYDEDNPFEVFLTSSNKLLFKVGEPDAPCFVRKMVPTRWYKNSWLRCSIWSRKKLHHYLVNIDSGEMRQIDKVVSPYTDSSVIKESEQGGFEIKKISEFPLVTEKDLP